MEHAKDRIEFRQWPWERVKAVKAEYLHEAAIALSTAREKRTFFITDPSKYGMTQESALERYHTYDQFTQAVWAEVDSILKGHEQLKPLLELEILYSSETALWPTLVVIQMGGGFAWGETIEYPKVDEFAQRLKDSWQRVLLSLREDETNSSGDAVDLDASFDELDQRLAETDFTDFAHVVDLIMRSDNDGEVKVRLIEMHQRGEQIFETVAGLLIDLAARIEAIGRPIRPAMKQVRDLVSTEERWKGLLKKLSATLKLELDPKVQIYLRPELLWPRAISVYYPRKGELFLGIGIYALELMERTDLVEDRFNAILEGTKILSDPTRLKVVLLLQSRSMYLKELADHLELSSATLSHHVQSMVAQKLLTVDITQQSRRVYYSLNPEAFSDLGRLISDLGSEK